MLLCEEPTWATMSCTLTSSPPRVQSIFRRSGWDMALREREARSMSLVAAEQGQALFHFFLLLGCRGGIIHNRILNVIPQEKQVSQNPNTIIHCFSIADSTR